MERTYEELNLEQLLSSAKRMPPKDCIDIYYDPDTHYFYVNPFDMISFWLPVGASFICREEAKDVRYGIEKFISQAVHKLIREDV